MKKILLILSIVYSLWSMVCFAQERIVSLSPVITEELYSLGLGDRIVGVTTYCQANGKEKVGIVTNANLEKIVSLRPDLVLAISLTKLRDIKKMKELGLRVVSFPQAESFQGLCEQFLELGRISGKEKEAQKIINNAKLQAGQIQNRIKGLPKTRVFVQIGAEPLYAAGKDSFINDFIKYGGGINVAGDFRSGIWSREKVIQQNPEVIIIATMGISGKKEGLVWDKFKALSAVKNKRVYAVDSYGICSPTPENFSQGLKKIAAMLHPEVEWK